MTSLSVSTGFVTSSSSVIHHFDERLLEDPEVKAFLEKFELTEGQMGRCLSRRDCCGSFLRTKEQKEAAWEELQGSRCPYGTYQESKPYTPPRPDSVVAIYGDEYMTPARALCELLIEAQERMSIADRTRQRMH